MLKCVIERRKSFGNFEEEQARSAAKRSRAMTQRNSSSLGNILGDCSQPSSFDEGGGLTMLTLEEQTLMRLVNQRATSAGRRSKNGSDDNVGADTTPSRSTKLRSSYYYERHPLSHSTTTILSGGGDDDALPIVPNRCPGTPDVWVPRSVKA